MSKMIEIWKDVIGYEGFYQISNYGNFKSLDRTIKVKHFYKKIASQTESNSFSVRLFYKCALNFSAITSFGDTPTNLSTTSPFLKIRTVGMFLIP